MVERRLKLLILQLAIIILAACSVILFALMWISGYGMFREVLNMLMLVILALVCLVSVYIFVRIKIPKRTPRRER